MVAFRAAASLVIGVALAMASVQKARGDAVACLGSPKKTGSWSYEFKNTCPNAVRYIVKTMGENRSPFFDAGEVSANGVITASSYFITEPVIVWACAATEPGCSNAAAIDMRDRIASGRQKAAAQAAKSSQETVMPPAQAAKPSIESVKPSTQAARPQMETVKPSMQAAKPSTELSNPSTQAAKPSTQTIMDVLKTKSMRELKWGITIKSNERGELILSNCCDLLCGDCIIPINGVMTFSTPPNEVFQQDVAQWVITSKVDANSVFLDIQARFRPAMRKALWTHRFSLRSSNECSIHETYTEDNPARSGSARRIVEEPHCSLQ